jgi:hypothetical protein
MKRAFFLLVVMSVFFSCSLAVAKNDAPPTDNDTPTIVYWWGAEGNGICFKVPYTLIASDRSIDFRWDEEGDLVITDDRSN